MRYEEQSLRLGKLMLCRDARLKSCLGLDRRGSDSLKSTSRG